MPPLCSSQVLKLKGLLTSTLCAQLVLPSSLLLLPWHRGWNQGGRPRTVLPTPSSAGAQDEGVREKDPAPTTQPRGCRTGKWQAALQAAENHHYPRAAVLGGKAWVCPFVFCSLGIIPRREIVGRMVNFWATVQLFRKWPHHFTFPSAMYDFWFFHILASTCYFSSLIIGTLVA